MKTLFPSFSRINWFILIISTFFILTKAQSQTFEWVKSFANPINSSTKGEIKIDDNGNIYIVSSFYGIIDINPGPGVNMVSSLDTMGIARRSTFIVKLDSLGNYIWGVAFGGESAYALEAEFMELDNNGNLVIAGNFHGTIDFDPGMGVFPIIGPVSGSGYSIGFILKLDTNGNFLWASSFDQSENVYFQAMTIDSLNNVIVLGTFRDTVDFDPGPSVYNLAAPGFYPKDFMRKLNSNGQFVWVKTFSSTGGRFNPLNISTVGDYYVVGTFADSAFVNTTSGIDTLVNLDGWSNSFITKMDTSGQFIWARAIGPGIVWGDEIKLDQSKNIIVTGYYNNPSVDFDPGPGVYNLNQDIINSGNGFILKLAEFR